MLLAEALTQSAQGWVPLHNLNSQMAPALGCKLQTQTGVGKDTFNPPGLTISSLV